jgi:hypothetical protein
MDGPAEKTFRAQRKRMAVGQRPATGVASFHQKICPPPPAEQPSTG